VILREISQRRQKSEFEISDCAAMSCCIRSDSLKVLRHSQTLRAAQKERLRHTFQSYEILKSLAGSFKQEQTCIFQCLSILCEVCRCISPSCGVAISNVYHVTQQNSDDQWKAHLFALLLYKTDAQWCSGAGEVGILQFTSIYFPYGIKERRPV
jgi:hypothetical protein